MHFPSDENKIYLGGGRVVPFFDLVICNCWSRLRGYFRDVGVEGQNDKEVLATVVGRGVSRKSEKGVDRLKLSVAANWSLHDPCGFHVFYLIACSDEDRGAVAVKELYVEGRLSASVDHGMSIGDRLIDFVQILLMTYARTVHERRVKPLLADKLEAGRTIMTRLFWQCFRISHWNEYNGDINECFKLRRPAALSNFVYSSHPAALQVETRVCSIAVPVEIERFAITLLDDEAFWSDETTIEVGVVSGFAYPVDVTVESNSKISDSF